MLMELQGPEPATPNLGLSSMRPMRSHTTADCDYRPPIGGLEITPTPGAASACSRGRLNAAAPQPRRRHRTATLRAHANPNAEPGI